MNKIKHKCEFLILVSFLLMSSPLVWGEPVIDSPVKENRITDFSEEELKEMRTRAISGDGAAANRIFLYYMSTTKTGAEGLEWLIIAVRNKHPEALQSFKNLKKQGVIDTWLKMLDQ